MIKRLFLCIIMVATNVYGVSPLKSVGAALKSLSGHVPRYHDISQVLSAYKIWQDWALGVESCHNDAKELENIEWQILKRKDAAQLAQFLLKDFDAIKDWKKILSCQSYQNITSAIQTLLSVINDDLDKKVPKDLSRVRQAKQKIIQVQYKQARDKQIRDDEVFARKLAAEVSQARPALALENPILRSPYRSPRPLMPSAQVPNATSPSLTELHAIADQGRKKINFLSRKPAINVGLSRNAHRPKEDPGSDSSASSFRLQHQLKQPRAPLAAPAISVCAEGDNSWACLICTYSNPTDAAACEVCSGPRLLAPSVKSFYVPQPVGVCSRPVSPTWGRSLPARAAGGDGSGGRERSGLSARLRSSSSRVRADSVPRDARAVAEGALLDPWVHPRINDYTFNGINVCTIGFHCACQSGVMCGFNSVCNIMSLVKAANSAGDDLITRLMRCPFKNIAAINTDKKSFDSKLGSRRTDEETGPLQLDRFFNYFIHNDPKPVGRGSGALCPDPIGRVYTSYSRFPADEEQEPIAREIHGVLEMLRGFGMSKENIIQELTRLKKLRYGESELLNGVRLDWTVLDKIRSYCHEFLDESTASGVFFTTRAGRMAIHLHKLHEIVTAGQLLIWADFYFVPGHRLGHWTSKCLFMHGGKLFLGCADSLTPGSISVSGKDKWLMGLILNPPISMEDIEIIQKVGC